jgi:hypothetical protein
VTGRTRSRGRRLLPGGRRNLPPLGRGLRTALEVQPRPLFEGWPQDLRAADDGGGRAGVDATHADAACGGVDYPDGAADGGTFECPRLDRRREHHLIAPDRLQPLIARA